MVLTDLSLEYLLTTSQVLNPRTLQLELEIVLIEEMVSLDHHITPPQLNLQLATNAVISGVGTTSNTSLDTQFVDPVGVNVRKTGQTVTLDYTDVEWLNQPYATRVENVTPFLVQFWKGTIELTPDVDVWIDTTQMEVNNVMMEGSFNGIA